jgi:hypothetical protein
MMTPEQQGRIAVIQSDIRSSLTFLAMLDVADLKGLRELQECLGKARDLADSLLLESGTPLAKTDTVQKIIEDIASEDSK